MLTIFLALSAGTLGGTVVGGLASGWLCERRLAGVPSDHEAIDPDVDHQINEATEQWATVHGRAVAYASRAALEGEVHLLEYGLVRAGGSAAKAELVARHVERLAASNYGRMMRRWGQW